MTSRRTFLGGMLAICSVPVVAVGSAAAQASPRSVAASHMVFVNTGSAPIVSVWMDFTGTEVIYSTIAPGASIVQDTFVGHIWRFRRGPSGPIFAQWVVDRPAGTLVIGDGGYTVH